MVKRQAKLPFAPPRASHTSAGGARKKSVVNCMPNVRNLVTKEKVDKFFQHPDERRRLKALALANEEPEAEWDDGGLFEESNAQRTASSSASSSSNAGGGSSSSYGVGGPGERHGRSTASNVPRASRPLPKSSRAWSEDRLGAERLESKAADRPSARAQADGSRKSADRTGRGRASRSDDGATSSRKPVATPAAPASSRAKGKRRRRTSHVPSALDESDAGQVSRAGGGAGADGEALGVLDGDALGVVVTMVPAPSAGAALSTGPVSAVTPASTAPTAPRAVAVPNLPVLVSATTAPDVEPPAAASNQPPALPKRMSFGARMRSAYEDSSSSDDEKAGPSMSATTSDSASTTCVNARDGRSGGDGGGRASVPGSDKFLLEVSRSGAKARRKNQNASAGRAERGSRREKDGQDTWNHYEARAGRRFRPFTSGDAETKRARGRAEESIESECDSDNEAQRDRETDEECRR